MTEYNQPAKKILRSEVLSRAVSLLTKDRPNASLVPAGYVGKVKSFFLSQNSGFDSDFASALPDNVIKKWEAFYLSLVGTRKPSDLKVAYLAGPNPANDLEVMVERGILSENVWAFESDKATYSQAVSSALNSRFPFIKIHRGDIADFFANSPVKFDIVYLDFLGPLPNRHKSQKNLEVITAALHYHVLSSPGVLITTFSFPEKAQDKIGWEYLTTLAAAYLYPKAFIERSEGMEDGAIEGPIAWSYNFCDWLTEIRTNPQEYYGQYITRLLIDAASFIIPYYSFATSNSYLRYFFSNVLDPRNQKNPRARLKTITKYFYEFSDNGGGGDLVAESHEFPFLWTTGVFNKAGINREFECLPRTDSGLSDFIQSFLRQLSFKNNSHDLIEKLELMYYLMGEGRYQECYYDPRLLNLSQNWKPFEKYVFCDVFLFHQLKDLLVRQLCIPYHTNIEKTARWTYKAKEMQMFVDLLVFDECRYIYDWAPTLDMLEYGLDNLERQLSYRFALDGVSKHNRWYNSEFFTGTAVVGSNHKGFEAKIMRRRQSITQ